MSLHAAVSCFFGRAFTTCAIIAESYRDFAQAVSHVTERLPNMAVPTSDFTLSHLLLAPIMTIYILVAIFVSSQPLSIDPHASPDCSVPATGSLRIDPRLRIPTIRVGKVNELKPGTLSLEGAQRCMLL